MSKSRVMPRRDARISGRPESMDRPDAMRTKARSGFTTSPGGPEWKSERWKREVEAEARTRLKKHIREIGSKR
jgi:hypothetical protein